MHVSCPAFLSHLVRCLTCGVDFFATVNGVPQIICTNDMSHDEERDRHAVVCSAARLEWQACDWEPMLDDTRATMALCLSLSFGRLISHLAERLCVTSAFVGVQP